MEKRKIANTTEFSEYIEDSPTSKQLVFPDNANIILTESDLRDDYMAQINEVGDYYGRSVHLC